MTYKGYQIYNRLPKEIRQMYKVNDFKRSLREELKKNRENYIV